MVFWKMFKMNEIHFLPALFVVLIALQINNASPPHQRMMNEDYDKLAQKESMQHNAPQTIDLEQFGIEYQRYLQQVIETLESDPEFKKKLESANESDIRSGKIAEELEYVSHHVRSKLDELKRIELDRLRQLAKKQYELERGRNVPKLPGHLDHSNPDSFEITDLQRLIYKVAEDLQEADRQRKELFKEYEMQKHFERDQKLSNMTEDERKQFLQHEEEELIKKRTQQKQIHHPGSRQQLEEVWEKQDHMDKQDFNPKVFFAMHDLDSNGFLDEEEIKVLFINELNKLYGKTDLVERDEEMERMREHVFNEIDLNKDRLISWNEFYSMSVRPEFNQDTGWNPIEENSVYTPEELETFERNKQAEINKLIQEGKISTDQNHPMYHYSLDGNHHEIKPMYDVPPQYPPHPNQGSQYQAYNQQVPPPAHAYGNGQGSYDSAQGQQIHNVPSSDQGSYSPQNYGRVSAQNMYNAPSQQGYNVHPYQQYQLNAEPVDGFHQPHAAQSQPQVVQLQPQVVQSQPQVIQSQPQVVPAQPQVVQSQPQVVPAQPQVAQQAQRQVVQSQPQVVQQAQPQVIQLQPQVVQPQPQVVQSQPQVVQAQPQVPLQPDMKFAQVNPIPMIQGQQLPLEEQQQQPSMSKKYHGDTHNDIPRA